MSGALGHICQPLYRCIALAGLLSLAPWMTGCDQTRLPPATDAGLTEIKSTACHACHGTPQSAAPAPALDGSMSTTHRGVGAHASHLTASSTHAAVACSACHTVPTSLYQAGHLDAEDGRATVVFAPRPGATVAAGTWDPEALTCNGVWCHGADLKSPGAKSKPIWNLVNATQRRCDSCHGSPPAAPHPQGDLAQKCHLCHSATVGQDGKIAAPELHVDGVVQVALAPSASCSSCHGNPPTDNHPNFITCKLCHAATVDDEGDLISGGGHLNGKVDFAMVPKTCDGCHGAPPKDKHPKMTKCQLCHPATVDEDGTLFAKGGHLNGKVEVMIVPKSCDGCHGAPPDSPKHPKMDRCGKCHAATVDDQGALVAGGKHMNGEVEFGYPAGCVACHGADTSPAPPPDHNGKVDPTLATVGAHTTHLKGKVYSAGGMKCTVCHKLPSTVDEPGHLVGDNQLAFPDQDARHKLSEPSFDAKTLTCSGVYCHGAKLKDGTAPTPKWTDTSLSCDGCHGTPPQSKAHAFLPAGDTTYCTACHKASVKPDGKIDLESGAHLNGKLEVQL